MSTSESTAKHWKAEIARRLHEGTGLEFSLAQFACAVGSEPADKSVQGFLDGLVTSRQAILIEGFLCPVLKCRRALAPAGAPYSLCPFCGTDYQEEGEAVLVQHFYRLAGEVSRDLEWLIVIHGMNTRGAWQQEFSWQIANRLRYSAPVLIYKYGWATVDVLVEWQHRRLAKQLGHSIRTAIRQAGDSKRSAIPDIIAHSFGTRLFALILEDPAFNDIRFGRVITAGSIVRPDFPWDRAIADHRLEAVLNHMAGTDKAVPFAQYVIPRSGPGGTAGYTDASVLNVRNAAFGHSDFFEAHNLRLLIADGGLWHSFLTHPLKHFSPDGAFKPDGPWKPALWLVRGLARVFGYGLFALAAPFSWIRRRVDP